LGLALSAPAARADAPPKPNIVFILSDDHRWDALGAAGNPAIHTPALDRLAARGAYFRQATTHVSQCLPVRATLLTGLTVHQHGAYSVQRQKPETTKPDAFQNLPTVPGLLRDAGYHTLLVGKWHLAAEPWLSGFSEVRSWLPAGGTEYKDPELARGNSRELSKTKGYTQQIFADDAISFVRSAAAKEKPFFLWLAFTAPHGPVAPNSPESEKLYAGKPASALPPPGFPKDIPAEDWRHYYEAVSDLDRQVGRVMAALEEAGLAESTAVVFLGDNGYMMGQRGIGLKDTPGKVVPYEGSIRVPLIVSSPGGKALAGPSDLPASSLDLPVTLVELAGLRPPSTWYGRDLLEALRRDPKNGLEDAFSEWADEENERWTAYRLVRTVRHKLILWKDPAKPGELYDLSADPAEEKNLYTRPEAREVRRDLEARLRAWMERTQDPAREWPKVTE
ncbi:MAG TPA: sulfatase-like hydrolase/transferase, partial [Thermoanaerobaculia bacterium]|nr:sulfatase-like hydrolase/transferase [Thermoanaerobaculia bacterium]